MILPVKSEFSLDGSAGVAANIRPQNLAVIPVKTKANEQNKVTQNIRNNDKTQQKTAGQRTEP